MAEVAAAQSVELGGAADVAAQALSVPPTRRISAMDSLRGCAVLGILVMNIYAFAMPFGAYGNPLLYGGTDTLNLGTWFVTHLFADQKFITIFSMLFGAGILLLTQRCEARGAPPLRTFYKRQVWLVVIGLIHGYLLWFGDILLAYALIGMLVCLLRGRPAPTLIVVGVTLLFVSPILSVAMGRYTAELKADATQYQLLAAAGRELDEDQQGRVDEWHESRKIFQPTDQELAEQIQLYGRGSYLEIRRDRAPLLTQMYVYSLLTYGWRVAALMILGMAFMKLGVLSAERPGATYVRFMAVGYGLGLPLATLSAVQLAAHQFDSIYIFKTGGHFNYVASLLVALGHVGLIMWLVRAGWLKGLMARLAAVGRMALSNYLMHSVVMTLIFYGYGLGLFGQVPRSQQMVFAAALLAFQLLISPVWFNYFRYGPAEWLWRSLTYGGRQRFRKPVQTA